MIFKINCELRLPGSPRTFQARESKLEPASFRTLARELLHQISPEPEQEPGVISHLAGIDPQWTEDFLKSI
ncbi:MAG TPA: hypothetical protein VM123_14175 [archaeon]|nr:hypothetical protein [archaeon]